MRVNVCKKIDEGIKTTLDVVLEDKTINLECEGIVVGGVTNDHARLVNLDYENSGHIGFASEKQLNLLAENVVPRRLNVLPNIDVNIDRSKQFIYINENDTESKKVSIRELNSYILRNGDCGPEYINNGGCSFDIGFPTSAEQRYSNELYFTLRKDEVGTLHVTVGLVFTL